MVVTCKTVIPRWACVFNTLPAFLILAPTKIPAKGNIANAFILKAKLPEVKITVDASCCACVTPESHKTALSAMKLCQINVINE